MLWQPSGPLGQRFSSLFSSLDKEVLTPRTRNPFIDTLVHTAATSSKREELAHVTQNSVQ